MPEEVHLALLPGFDGSGLLFKRLRKALPDSYRLITISYGAGRSLENYVTEVSTLLPEHSRISLLAESFSGPIAIELLARNEFDFGPSILCATFPKPPARMLARLAASLPAPRLISMPLAALTLRTMCTNGVDDAQLRREIIDVLAQLSPAALKSRLRTVADIDVTNRLPAIKVPVLYLQARHDRLVRRRHAQALMKGIRDIRLVEIDAPHMLLQAKPHDAAETITRFISDHPA